MSNGVVASVVTGQWLANARARLRHGGWLFTAAIQAGLRQAIRARTATKPQETSLNA